VARIRYTKRAESDLDEIGAYTLETWGAAQCVRYLSALETACHGLLEDPQASREYRRRPAYRRSSSKASTWCSSAGATTVML
jgi:plasmid stabilization system protein ParE